MVIGKEINFMLRLNRGKSNLSDRLTLTKSCPAMQRTKSQE